MIYSDILQKIRNFNIIINTNFEIESVSNNILQTDIGEKFFNIDVFTLFSKAIMFDDIDGNNGKMQEFDLHNHIRMVFKGNEIHDKSIVITLDTSKGLMNYSFFFTAILLKGIIDGSVRESVSILIRDYKKFDSDEERYLNHFNQFDEIFELVKKMNVCGRFVIDFELNKYKVYGNEVLPGLIGLKKTKDNFYKLNGRNDESILEGSIIRSEPFHDKMDLLMTEKIDILTDEWHVSDKWLRLEAKILTRTSTGKPKMVGGVIYDITDFHKNKDLVRDNLFYELAITSGEIGLFHYDLEEHDNSVFTANKRYGELMGLEPNKDGLYRTEDFLSAQLSIEEDISSYEEVHVQVNKLFKGETKGTNDDVLKIRNLKNGEIKYLLSSSKIESYFEDGSAKRLGGIVIDITDRITKEKNQTEFLYKDELTSLGNNRLLAKNLLVANDGLGLFFDLDNFKKINDTYGHLMGDEMIKVFGYCLDKVANEYENISVYRLYGDEFFVFCETRHKSFGVIYERKVKELLLREMKKTKEKIILEASMGAAMFKKGSSIDDFIKNADYSMYEAKINKKKREN